MLTEITHPTQQKLGKGAIPIYNTDINPIIQYVNDNRNELASLRKIVEQLTKQLEQIQVYIDKFNSEPIEIVPVESNMVQVNNIPLMEELPTVISLDSYPPQIVITTPQPKVKIKRKQ